MNKIIVTGNLASDIDIREYGDSGKVSNGRIAVRRENGKDETDFFNFTAFGNQATYLASYAQKGNFVELCGRLQNRSYEKDGEKRIVTEIIVERAELVGGKKSDDGEQKAKPQGKPTLPEDCPF